MASRLTEISRSISKEFMNSKQITLVHTDRSKKGSIDAPISSLIERINASPYFYTTSSCSGRIIIFSEKEGDKHSCRWIFTSHKTCIPEQVLDEIRNGISPEDRSITLKFEPLILHVCCASVECAKTLMKAVVGCGYRNSGLSLGKRILLAVRSTQGMEVPLGREGKIMVEEEYLAFLIEQANTKMQLNSRRIERLEVIVTDIMEKLEHEEREEEIKKSRIINNKYEREVTNVEENNVEEFMDEDNILENLFQN